jgi:hypothetical protein
MSGRWPMARNAVLDTGGLLQANFDSSRKRRAAQHAAKTSFVPHWELEAL